MFKTPHRRLRVLIKTALVMVILFLGTLLVCSVVYIFFLTRGVKILSPITQLSLQKSVADLDKERVKTFCQKNNLSCQSITQIDDESLALTLDTTSQVFFSTKKDIGNQLASLQSIIGQLTIKGKQFKKLDFRFDTVVVSF